MQQTLISFFCFVFLVFSSKVLCENQNTCRELKCRKHGPAIRFPFSLKGSHPENCGYPGFLVSCNEKRETILELPIPVKFAIKTIDYENQYIQLYDPENCLLVKLLKVYNMPISPFNYSEYQMTNITLFNCSSAERQLANNKVPCFEGPAGYQIYSLDSEEEEEEDTSLIPLLSCTKMYDYSSVPYSSYKPANLHVEWSEPSCKRCEAQGNKCGLKKNGTESTEIECLYRKGGSQKKLLVATGASLGSFVLVLLVAAVYHVYSSDRKEKENQLKIEVFLEDYRALKPSRYSYADIKRITNQFKEKLGQGAYGTVFKGELSAECFVAVKVLNSTKGNGEEFVNEVGTMGHIHHVNVVRLVGFCADGFRRALVYDFLPNGSLQDFLSSAGNNNSFLGWGKLQDISLGIAKGIEYLHQGCNQQILHFDIKPHNVLLDHNFNPKISDFGLAKLCSKDQSIVSMTTARGTMGYIAPEVFSRNFGNVSYKSDVYSYGMVLLEIVGGRRNFGSTTENTNEVYYPEWIYNLLEEKVDLPINVREEGDAKIAKRLAIVGLWCIQWHPADRPSMQRVVQMLEGGENLTMPQNPFASQGPAGTNTSAPSRNLNLQLEVIPELEQ
ncbi:putative glycerophosphodiester phosphodiesterase, protein kinase RLK-Pelle-LRK10L-2 family [Rosa chinensis]|uniref:Putative glycerophosphodiester phosphodiesterase, protein kinase RLK-Pelle-LRK10L-2 family n=1 Tax=Rosa chinensis TaxID=74649 RepID=A0A2P6SC34_ROSCH|nr:rust resistance kinase Lr10-like [Rosa chinensis]PRQ56227.1 putative glycerophosphodiester phosphodiesterase, protein kinase RLK-Pelle-LRK10L-2 family [Rosa chinensis]